MSLYTPPSYPQPQIPDYALRMEEIQKAAEEGKQDFINRIAEATGSELAKAIRKTPFIFDEIVGALASLCGNCYYNASSDEIVICTIYKGLQTKVLLR